MRKTFTLVEFSHLMAMGKKFLTRAEGDLNVLLPKSDLSQADKDFVMRNFDEFRRECNGVLDDLCLELAQRGAKRGRR